MQTVYAVFFVGFHDFTCTGSILPEGIYKFSACMPTTAPSIERSRQEILINLLFLWTVPTKFSSISSKSNIVLTSARATGRNLKLK